MSDLTNEVDPGFKVTLPDPAVLGRAVRQTRRLSDVLGILVKYGFEDIVAAVRSGRRHSKAELPALGETAGRQNRAERVRRVLEELGPTYVKLGQILSTRPDIVGPDLMAELVKLQDDVSPVGFDEVRSTILHEFGAPLEEVFDEFDPEPLASASLGQVHRATWASRPVAVKVQRPAIRSTIDADLDLMTQVAELLERHISGWDVHQPTRIIKEFAATLERELDYELEASHQERFAQQFADDPTIFVPAVYREASTSRILTMDFVEGVKVSNFEALERIGADRKRVAAQGFRLVLEQALVTGFFHADPHPGNIFVLPDDVISFIDFGMMGRLSQKVRDEFVELIYHIVDDNPPRVARSVLRLTIQDRPADVNALERDVAQFMDAYLGRPLASLNLNQILGEILQALVRHRLRLPPDLYLMLKAISAIESLAVALDPDFDLVQEASPYVRRIFMDRFRPTRIAKDLAGTGRELAHALRDAPDALRELSEQARSGQLRIQLQQEHLPKVLRVSSAIGNRLALAFVLGSSLVGSAIVAAAEIPPLWRGISLLGLGGFVVSLFLSFLLMIAIVRHGKL